MGQHGRQWAGLREGGVARRGSLSALLPSKQLWEKEQRRARAAWRHGGLFLQNRLGGGGKRGASALLRQKRQAGGRATAHGAA